MMKRVGLGLLAVLGWGSWTVHGSETQGPWEKAGIEAGVFFSRLQSSVRYGSGIGVDLDPEDLFGLEAQEIVFRTSGFWRFTNNRRHRADFMWFSFRRDANRMVTEDFDLPDRNGDLIPVVAGTEVQSTFDVDIYETSYSYSFFQDDRFDLAARVGLYTMPIQSEVRASGFSDTQSSFKFTAPLPVIGYRLDMLLTPKWAVRTGTQIFYFKYQSFEGSLVQAQGAVEYKVFKNTALGVGVDTFNFDFSATNTDYPGVDLDGSVGFQYTGLQLYARWAFD
jgi:hypothetical protein